MGTGANFQPLSLAEGGSIIIEPIEQDARGRIIIRATITGHGLIGVGNRLSVMAVAGDDVVSRIARTTAFRIA